MPPKSVTRVSQRTDLACTSCVRRKIRCSKTVPCTTCTLRNESHLCHREPVAVAARKERSTPRRATPVKQNEASRCSSSTRAHSEPTDSFTGLDISGSQALGAVLEPYRGTMLDGSRSEFSSTPAARDSRVTADDSQSLWMRAANSKSSANSPANPLKASDRITNETAASLEFLAHGHRTILKQFTEQNQSGLVQTAIPTGTAEDSLRTEAGLSIAEGRTLLALHENHLVWMHDVVDMPSFQIMFEERIKSNDFTKSWLALYIAIIAHTAYHLGEVASPQFTDTTLTRSLFDKSVTLLYEADYMSNHNIFSIQAICILTQIAHNIDKSDLICVLLSSAVRIAQCLNLHRLGPDTPEDSQCPRSYQEISERETQKRIWWFLVRYDWLQIPFQDTWQISPVQNNTPMPAHCHDGSDQIIREGVVVPESKDLHTPRSWTCSLHEVSVVIWKHQDRMHDAGFLGRPTLQNPLKLYNQVTWADKELKDHHLSWECFDSKRPLSMHSAFPNQRTPGIALLSLAHKILTVHRHFQLSSFRDRRFSFTQLSCVSIAERTLDEIQSWPDDLDSQVARKMWTTLTHLISCSITLTFALLFRKKNAFMHDFDKLRRHVEFARSFLLREEHTSSIAHRGVRILTALLHLEGSSETSEDIEGEIGNAIRCVAAEDGRVEDLNMSNTHQIVFPQEIWQEFINDYTATEVLDL